MFEQQASCCCCCCVHGTNHPLSTNAQRPSESTWGSPCGDPIQPVNQPSVKAPQHNSPHEASNLSHKQLKLRMPEHQWEWPSCQFKPSILNKHRLIASCLGALHQAGLQSPNTKGPHPCMQSLLPNKSKTLGSKRHPCCGGQMFENQRMVHSKLMVGQTIIARITRGSPRCEPLKATNSNNNNSSSPNATPSWSPLASTIVSVGEASDTECCVELMSTGSCFDSS